MRFRRRAKFLIAIVIATAGWVSAPPAALVPASAAISAGLPDPALAGPFEPTRVEYDAGPTVVTDPKGATYPAELAGVLWFPKTAPGARPVVLLLHGNHGTCAVAGVGGSAYPCPGTAATSPIPSYAGYDYLASNLASHGFIVASLDANGVNTYNVVGDKGANERAQLLARTLDLLASWNTSPGPAPVGPSLIGRVDLTRIGMMGHSRGGEGVTTFLDYNQTRTDGPHYKVTATFVLAGTDYNLPTATGAAFATLLPLCDGDVYDLQSAFPWDRGHVTSADSPFPRVQFTVQGTNHNYFNTVWDSDDFAGRPPDGACTPTSKTTDRLAPPDQRRVGLVLVAAFMRRYVNGETAFDPLMTGEAELPASACPGGTGPCSGLVGRSYVAPASERRYLISPRPEGDTLHLTAEGRPLTTTGFTVVSFCDPHADTGADGNNRDPGLASGCPTNPNRSRVRQLTLSWTGPATLRAELAARDVRHLGALHLRTAVDFQDSLNTAGQPQDMGITLVGGNGRRVTMPAREYSAALMPPPGDAARQLTLNGVRIPLADFAAGGIDLTDVAAVELNFGGPDRPASGSVQLAQLSFQEPVSAADAGSNVDGTAGRATANVVGAGQPHGDLPATGGATDLSIGLGVLAAGLGARRLSRRRIFAAGRGAVSSFRQ